MGCWGLAMVELDYLFHPMGPSSRRSHRVGTGSTFQSFDNLVMHMVETQDRREANKRVAQQIYDVWDGGDEDALNELIADDVVFDKPDHLGGQVHGRDAYKKNLRMVRAGFPDLFFRAQEVVAEDDRVMAYCTFGGTHEGTLMGVEPTGTSVEVWDFVSYRFDDGKVVEVISFPDLYGLLLQVGHVEPLGE